MNKLEKLEQNVKDAQADYEVAEIAFDDDCVEAARVAEAACNAAEDDYDAACDVASDIARATKVAAKGAYDAREAASQATYDAAETAFELATKTLNDYLDEKGE